ncbi:MAG: SAM-dependent methyltransferase, partial [Pricia sp.]
MNQANLQSIPKILSSIQRKSEEIGFTMPSDVYIGTLLKTLIASKPGGRFLELGTGIGLSLSWMVDGMDAESHLVTVDNDPELIDIAKSYFGEDDRVEIICQDGS